MSSTNRGSARDTHIADYYRTPIKPIMEFLEAFDFKSRVNSTRRILDPCAGGSSKDVMSYPEAINEYYNNNKLFAPEIKTLDIREDSLAVIKADYLSYTIERKPHVVITNPPFAIAQQIIEKSLQDVIDGGYVIMLLRLNYFGSDGRFPFWQNNLPIEAYVHHKRLSFTEDNKTDSIEYMHCVWKKGTNPLHCKLKVI
jgi:hypothetical protein